MVKSCIWINISQRVGKFESVYLRHIAFVTLKFHRICTNLENALKHACFWKWPSPSNAVTHHVKDLCDLYVKQITCTWKEMTSQCTGDWGKWSIHSKGHCKLSPKYSSEISSENIKKMIWPHLCQSQLYTASDIF